MKMKKTIIYQMMLGMVLMLGTVLTLGLTGCSESGDDDGSSGKGSVAIRLRTQYVHATRATGDWADPTNTIEKPQAPTPYMALPTSTATPRLLRMATAR